MKAEGVCELVFPGVRTCVAFEEGIPHLWRGGNGRPPVGWGSEEGWGGGGWGGGTHAKDVLQFRPEDREGGLGGRRCVERWSDALLGQGTTFTAPSLPLPHSSLPPALSFFRPPAPPSAPEGGGRALASVKVPFRIAFPGGFVAQRDTSRGSAHNRLPVDMADPSCRGHFPLCPGYTKPSLSG